MMAGAIVGCTGMSRRTDIYGPPSNFPQTAEILAVQSERALVRTARLDVSVRDLGTARARATATVRALGGSLEMEGVRERSATLRLRVPEATLDGALDSLSGLGKVQHRWTGAEDRSAQVADLDARVNNLKASRDRLRALYERSTTVADIVAVERELARVQGELDSLEAQLKYVRSAAAMSVLELTLDQKPVLGPLGLLFSGIGWVITKLFVLR